MGLFCIEFMVQGEREMLNIAICDDDRFFCEREQQFIAEYMNVKEYAYQIYTFPSGEDLLHAKQDISRYDIIFLDIKMDKIDGIETARRIREIAIDTYIVFVTAFIEYSLEGYKVDAIRYLLKDDEFLDKAIFECLDAIMDKKNYRENKYTFEFQEGKIEICLNDIMYIDSNLHKLTFHMAKESQGEYTMYERLDVIDELLRKMKFCRIHKSYLVNLSYLDRIERYNAVMSEGLYLPVSKARYLNARNEWIRYKGEM